MKKPKYFGQRIRKDKSPLLKAVGMGFRGVAATPHVVTFSTRRRRYSGPKNNSSQIEIVNDGTSPRLVFTLNWETLVYTITDYTPSPLSGYLREEDIRNGYASFRATLATKLEWYLQMNGYSKV